MTYVAVKDLKRSKQLWDKLAAEKELVITRDGQPCAVLVSIQPDQLEDSLAEIRRALFSAAVGRARKRAQTTPPSDRAVEHLVTETRQDRR